MTRRYAASSSNFNPRSSYEERRDIREVMAAINKISIHAPHTRSDGTGISRISSASHFNPRSSYEERQPYFYPFIFLAFIHLFREPPFSPLLTSHFFSNISPLHFCVIALRAPLKNHRCFRIIGVLCADMFYLSLIILPEMIKPQTVFFRIDGLFELMPEFRELCCVEAAFENRILHSLSVTHADLCYLPKTFFPFCRRRIDIICNQYQHITTT